MCVSEGEPVIDDDAEDSRPLQSRRALFALLGVGAAISAAKAATAQVSKQGGLSDTQLRNRLLRRITYGPTQQDLTLFQQLGWDGYIDYQLNWEAIDDSACEREVAWYSTVYFAEHDILKVQQDVAQHELAAATMLRAVLSKRQLYQRMVEFWTDHFNIWFDKVGVLSLIHDREVVRKNALGNFKQFLTANTKSPATIIFLDNQTNVKEYPNQNLGRELMELHSIGIGGKYTQADVLNVSKCLTGWTYRSWPPDARDIGQFVFDNTEHTWATKVVLGATMAPGGGINDGETVLRLLYSGRKAARFFGTKLWNYFLGYAPTTDQVENLADIYIANNGDIKPMVKAILTKENLDIAPLMMKRPFHYAMGLLRQSEAEIDSLYNLRDWLYSMGQHPLNWAAPNGYPQAPAYWTANLLPRWNFPFELFGNTIDSVKVDRFKLMKTAVLRADVLYRINWILFQGEMTAADKDAINTYLVADENALGKSMPAMATAAGLPGYQKC